jgi:hypothetical protein
MQLRSASRVVVTLIALLMGVIAALHPFARVTDPAIGSFDKVICPFFLLAPLFVDSPQWRDAPFFILAVASNALLYAFGAWKITGVGRKKTGTGNP